MRIYFVIILLLLTLFSDAQIRIKNYGKSDSIKTALSHSSGITRIDNLNALSEAYFWLNIDSAKLLANKALYEAQSYNYIKGMLGAYNNLAWINWHSNKSYPEMETYCMSAILLMEQTETIDQLPTFYFLLGLSLLAQSKYTQAISSFQKAGQLYSNAGDELNLGNMFNYIAYVEHLRGHYGSSLLYSEKYLRIGQKYNDLKYMDVWGELYEVIGDYETALGYYQHAAANTRFTQKTDDLIFFTRCIGEVHFLQKKYDSALFYYNRLISLFPAVDMPKPFLGELYLALQQYEKAQQQLLYALSYYKREGGLSDAMWVLLRLCKLYKEKGDNKAATRYATELLQLAYRSEARQYIRDGHLLLYQLLAPTTKQQEAFTHLQKYTAIKDTIDKDLSAQQLAYYKISADKEKAQSRINLLNEEKKLHQQVIKQTTLQKNFLIASLVSLCIISFFIVRSIILKRKSEKMRLENLLKVEMLRSEKRQAELRQQASEMELQALRAQMNPHFIFNCLNAINLFILKKENQSASDYLTRFARLVRLILQTSSQKVILLQEELEIIRLYIELEQMRFKQHFTYSITYDPSLDTESVSIPPMLLQPFKENAIWHGLMHTDKVGHLSIELDLKDNFLSCIIIDNGIGRNKATQLKSKSAAQHKSMGLQITANRLKMLSKETNQHYLLQVTDLKDPLGGDSGTKVKVNIPIKTIQYMTL